MIFYRVAHKVSEMGVYNHNYHCNNDIELDKYHYGLLDDLILEHSCDSNMHRTPTLIDDSFIRSNENYIDNLCSSRDLDIEGTLPVNVYCFCSLEQLNNWFTKK